MLRGGAELYTSNDYQWCIPYVYVNSTWKRAVPYVFNGAWRLVGGGGVPYDYYIDKNGNYFMIGNDYFLVPRSYNYIKLRDSESKYLITSEGTNLQVRGE